MKTLLPTLLLTAAFLSAGAFAGHSLPAGAANETVVFKSSVMPLKARMVIAPCEEGGCLAI